ncbi:MAG TPA: ABC transporter permease [Bacilli bacterium]
MMHILNIAKKEIKSDFRDFRTLVFMLAFPIVLMLILGTALTNAFSSNVQLGDIKLLYTVDAGSSLTSSWQQFVKEAGGFDIQFVQAKPGTDGKSKVEDYTYTGYVEVTDNGLDYFGSSIDTIQSNVLQGMLNAFADKYNLASSAAKTDPAKIGEILAASAHGDYVQERTLHAGKAPGSLDYYAMAMTTMIVMYAAIGASTLINREKRYNTALRLLASPVSRGKIFTGKVLGNIVLNLLCVVIVVAFSRFVYQANWGTHYDAVFLVLLSETALAVSIGLAISYFLKGEASRGVLTILIQIFAFIGGAYFPVGAVGGDFLSFLPNLSPIYWANRSLTQIIYDGNVLAALPTAGLNFGLAALLIMLAASAMNRREGF